MEDLRRDSQAHHDEEFERLKAAALRGTRRTPHERAAGRTTKLSREEREELLNDVFEVDGNDSARLSDKIRERLARVDITFPTIVVRYRNLSVIARVRVGMVTVPTITSAAVSPLEPVLRHVNLAHPVASYPILDNVSGVLHPGRITLLLGPPGAGKSTFLKTLAGYNRREVGIDIRYDELTYNGRSFDTFVVERSSAYIGQIENHYGELTVRETFDFAARCQSSGHRADTLLEVEARERERGIEPDPEIVAFMNATNASKGAGSSLMVELTIRLLGLERCADTLVGNAMMRGISGGQKKRVTTGELIVGATRALFMDEISTGLDSNTTFTITRTFGTMCRSLRTTLLIGLLQPGPETFELFDDVILLASARTPFFGPREEALPFFESLGFYCPNRVGVADFLQEIATPNDQHKYWNPDNAKEHTYMSVSLLQRRWAKTPSGRRMDEELAKPFAPPEGEGRGDDSALSETRYSQSALELLRANIWRWWVLQKRLMFFTYFRLFQITLMALVTGTLFIQMHRRNPLQATHFYGVMFFTTQYMMLPTISDMHVLVGRLPVMQKQRTARFYPGWCFAAPTILNRLPFCFIEATVWSQLVYWMCGFATGPRVVMFWFISFCVSVWSVIFFVTIGSIARDDTIGTGVVAFFLTVFLNLSGMVLNPSDIPGWWLGGFWGNPLSYAFRALAINEFTSKYWNWVYPLLPNETLGRAMLSERGLQHDYWWCWVAYAFLIGTSVLNFVVYVTAITFLEPLHRSPVLSAEQLEEMAAAREDGEVEVQDGYGRSSVHRLSEISHANSAVAEGTASSVAARKPSLLSGRASGDLEEAGTGTEQESALPFTPMVVTFREVEYSVPVPPSADREKADIPTEGPHAGALRLLKHIDGVFRPKILTALMGASGAGKTTLMDVLASRKTGGTITGDIRVNGYPQVPKTFARVMGYVEQTDIHIPQATVREALTFSASLRLPSSVTAETREAFVEEIMGLVELDKLENAHVGTPGVDGLSVEQRKRLTLAVELVANPSIVFMDEPTSGLDARAAAIVMRSVRSTVDSGRTVVCTIHQPSFDIFRCFDELLLLKPGGRTIFNGPIGEDSCKLIEYFEGLPGVAPIEPRINPANWMLDQTNPEAEHRLGVDFNDLYYNSEMCKGIHAMLDRYEQPPEGVSDINVDGLKIPNSLVQFRVLLQRNFRTYWRCPEYNVTRFAITLMLALFLGSMFYKLGMDRNNVSGVLNIMGMIFTSVIFLGVINSLTVQHLFVVQRTVFYRERAAGIYSEMPFGLAALIVEIPYLLVQATAFMIITYFMIGFQHDAGKFFWFWFFFFESLLYFTFFGILCIAVVPAVPFASNVATFAVAFWTLMSGFLIAKPEIRGWWIWAYYTCPVAWSIYGSITSQLGDLNDEYITDFFGDTWTIKAYLKDAFGFQLKVLPAIIFILLAYSLLFASITVFSLYKLNFQNR